MTEKQQIVVWRKVLKAHLPPEKRRGIIDIKKGLSRFTTDTLTDEKTLEEELTRIRMQSVAIYMTR